MIDNPFDPQRELIRWAASVGIAALLAVGIIMTGAPVSRIANRDTDREWRSVFPDATLTPSGDVCVVRDTPEAIWEWVSRHPRRIRRIETQADEQGYRTELTWVTP